MLLHSTSLARISFVCNQHRVNVAPSWCQMQNCGFRPSVVRRPSRQSHADLPHIFLIFRSFWSAACLNGTVGQGSGWIPPHAPPCRRRGACLCPSGSAYLHRQRRSASRPHRPNQNPSLPDDLLAHALAFLPPDSICPLRTECAAVVVSQVSKSLRILALSNAERRA